MNFEHILKTTKVVKTYNEAISKVTLPKKGIRYNVLCQFLTNGIFSLIKRGVVRAIAFFFLFLTSSSIYACYNEWLLSTMESYVSIFRVAFLTTFKSSISLVCSTLVKNRSYLSIFLIFLLALVSLILYRLFERLYLWSTNEYMEATNVKDHPLYQDKKLMDYAWKCAEKVGWSIPQNNVTRKLFQSKFGLFDVTKGGSVVYQPRIGFCGIASLNSILRSFPRVKKEEAAIDSTPLPYLKMHADGLYLELLQAEAILNKIIFNHSHTTWEKMGGGSIASIKVLGGGKNGFPSYEAFIHALKQINHPTQPARILALFGRSPLFFCHDGNIFTKIKTYMMGHWSPLPAYIEEKDLVLVMDVNHSYGSNGYLIPTKRLYDAVNTRCCMNGKYRGLILLRPPPPPSPSVPLLHSPREISLAMGSIKQQYYSHIAKTTDNVNIVQDSLLTTIVSKHPITFTNSTFINNLHGIRYQDLLKHYKIFSDATCPMRLTVRGCTNNKDFQNISNMCNKVGLVLLMKSTKTWILPLMLTRNMKPPKSPKEYYLEEIVTGDIDTIHQWGHVVATSYGMPNVKRNNMSPSTFFGSTYENVIHGTNLRQFVLRSKNISDKSKNVVATCTLYVNDTKTIGCMFNVCCLKNHRRKGIGKFMSKVIIYHATVMGCKQLLLEASPKGEYVYKQLGFVQSEEKPNLSGTFVSINIGTKSCHWKLLLILIEYIIQYKNTLQKCCLIGAVVFFAMFFIEHY
jgi:N-acetylglutamate synthase-like GNAT family acetyltransferase